MENQKDYMRLIKKNDSLDVTNFLNRLEYMNISITAFPDASEEDKFDDEELKMLFYKAMPARWRTNFISAAQDPHESELEFIRNYMAEQGVLTNEYRKKNQKNNKDKGKGSDNSHNQKNHSNNNNYNKKKRKDGFKDS